MSSSAPLAVIEGGAVSAEILEQVVVQNDLSKLTAPQRLEYYEGLCRSLELNPLTRPFQYVNLSGKLVLYATRDATEQIRKRHGVSITIVDRQLIGDIYIVTAKAKNAQGREDESTGAVMIAGLKGENLANAYMKAETKAKRRVTLSFCGLGVLDEIEVESIRDASFVDLNPDGSVPANGQVGPVVEAPAPQTNAAAEAMAKAAAATAPMQAEVIDAEVVQESPSVAAQAPIEPSADQRAMFFAVWHEIGGPGHSDPTDKAVNYKVWSMFIGREITSWTQLDKAEIGRLIDWMERVKAGTKAPPKFGQIRDSITGQAVIAAVAEPPAKRGIIEGFKALREALPLTDEQAVALVDAHRGEKNVDDKAVAGWLRGFTTFEQFLELFSDPFDELPELAS